MLHTGAESRVRTDTVLHWPIFEKTLSSLRRYSFLTFKKEEDYTYLPDMFQTTPQLSPVTPMSISTDPVEIERLINRFFALVHVKNPILDRQIVKQYYQEYCENGPAFNLRSCLILLVCALACASPEFHPSAPLGPNHGHSRSRPLGGENLDMAQSYFAEAEKCLGAAMTQHNSLAVQCMFLAGIYHMATVNPVAGHAMFHNAGYIMQMLASTGQNTLEESSQVGSSLYWACFKSERELFAEMPIAIPALGRPSQASSYPLPPQDRFMTWPNSPQIWAQAEEDSWYFFLSEIAMRRIVDEVAELVSNCLTNLFTNPSPTSVVTILDEYAPIAAEFERQALAWRDHLPSCLQFPDVPAPAPSEWMLVTRQPYYRTMELMHRPFTYACVHNLASSPIVLSLAEKGLLHAQQYLKACHPTHAHHGRAIQLRNELRMVAMLFAASGCGVNMPGGWYEDVKAVVRSLLYWEEAAPFVRSYLDVVVALDEYFKGAGGECTGDLRREMEMETS
ncbi:hypothetical protein BS50DRAFT_492831 [Corynespora cassiicola Philippines]|uniref:Xylanolytic transcriptional activator regulatory domain-containing protein n=1 Tax=Corynespora cassiicola Philippines TaxID=1448308 RepID=A0A2T2NQF6_CORCC|nr:hypothetical protein BS50DRAFT_492831 [Corynespora cassiicola Philippines]